MFFSFHLSKIITRYRRIGYKLNVMRQSACLCFNPIMVDNRRHYELIFEFNVGLTTLLREGLSKPEFYGSLVYKVKKLIGTNDFSFHLSKIITRYRRIGYKLNVMRQSACLCFNPIMVDNYAAFFNCTPVGSGVRLYDAPDIKLFILVVWGWSFFSVAWPTFIMIYLFIHDDSLTS